MIFNKKGNLNFNTTQDRFYSRKKIVRHLEYLEQLEANDKMRIQLK